MRTDKGTTRILSVSAGLFLSLGLLAAVGPSLPAFARNNSISLATAGTIFTALFLGAIPTQILTGWLNERFGTKPVLFFGTLILGAGLLGATLSPYLPLTLACMVFAGLGDGVLVVGANVIVAQTFPNRRASALNLLNVFYGVGAIAGPAIASVAIGLWGTGIPSIWALAIVLVLLAPTIPGMRLRGEMDREVKEGDGSTAPVIPLYRSSHLWLFSLIMLLYVGIEVGTGGWIATYMQRTTHVAPQDGALVGSIFYFALTGGRVIAAGLGTKLSAERLLMVSLVGAVIGAIGMSLVVGNRALTIASIVVLGASIAPVFATVLAIVTAHFPAGAAKAASVVIAAGSIGATLIPLLLGAVLEGFGAQALAQVAVVDTLGMLLLLVAAGLIEKKNKGEVRVQAVAESPQVR